MDFSASLTSTVQQGGVEEEQGQHPQPQPQPQHHHHHHHHQEHQQRQQQVIETVHLNENCMRDEHGSPFSCPSKQGSTPSPLATFTNNSLMKSALDQIVLLDHCYDSRDQDENYLPENINRASLISQIRAIRSSGQIQYRIPKRRREGGSKKRKPRDDMEVDDASELSDEIVTVNRQKRVKRAPVRPRERADRGSPYDKHLRKKAKQERPSGGESTSSANPVETPCLPETT